ncbi:MAG: hypothetical protein ACR5K2_00080 [Wolbachia sp.]
MKDVQDHIHDVYTKTTYKGWNIQR